MSALESFEKLLAQGQDNALLRYSLAMEYLKLNHTDRAIEHLKAALQHDPTYSAAWKHLGRAYEAGGDLSQAANTYSKGIEAAEKRGDKQAAKEMGVFLRRINKNKD